MHDRFMQKENLFPAGSVNRAPLAEHMSQVGRHHHRPPKTRSLHRRTANCCKMRFASFPFFLGRNNQAAATTEMRPKCL